MFTKPLFAVVAILALATMACGITIDLPVENINTGPIQNEEINIPPLDSTNIVELSLGFGAGELIINPGAEGALVKGTATYNVRDLKPDITVTGNDVRLETGDLEIQGVPNFGGSYRNEWDLQLGDQPMDLNISAGAYEGKIELGGLALHTLRVGDGASKVELGFSQPNPVVMSTLRYETGFSSVALSGLANANAESVAFKSGAGEYTLDFTGDLQRDMDVSIDTGLSSVKIIVPKGVSARIFFDGSLSNVDVHGDWERSGDEYFNPGDGARITIHIDSGAGSIELRN